MRVPLRIFWIVAVRAHALWRPLDMIRPEIVMTITPAHISPIIALIAGILILIMPRLLRTQYVAITFLGRDYGCSTALSSHPL